MMVSDGWLISQLPLLFQKISQQLFLVIISVSLAILVGVPLGILAYRQRRLQSLLLAVASLTQTIPSLALLAFLLPILGIGVKPTIVALIIYALLPIISNTVAGLSSVPSAVIAAADAMGFTKLQKLKIVELPLAMPTIFSGLRTATAMCVGIATIAAFVGAGGLGDFIYQGISLNSNRLVWLGAIPAAILALLFDYYIVQLQQLFTRRRRQSKIKLFKVVIISVLILLLMFLPWILIKKYEKNNTIYIGTKNFTEQIILGHLIADMIKQKTHLQVVEKFDLGSTAICHRALLRGDIDIYPEYTGTAYLTVLNETEKRSSAQLYYIVKKAYQDRFNIIWLSPFGFNNSQGLAVTDLFAKANHLETIGDLAKISTKLTIAAPAEFIERTDGMIGLQNTYGMRFRAIKQMDPGLLYDAIDNNSVQVIVAFTTDARLISGKLTVLKDNLQLFPAYMAAPLVRAETLARHPEIIAALQPLSGLINNASMQKMNYEVEILKKSPALVALSFLKNRGLLH